MLMKRMCTLLLWDERLSICQLSPFHPGHCSIAGYSISMNLSVFEFFSFSLVSSFRPLCSEKMLDLISIFLNLLRVILCRIMWSIFGNVLCAFEKNVYFASLG